MLLLLWDDTQLTSVIPRYIKFGGVACDQLLLMVYLTGLRQISLCISHWLLSCPADTLSSLKTLLIIASLTTLAAVCRSTWKQLASSSRTLRRMDQWRTSVSSWIWPTIRRALICTTLSVIYKSVCTHYAPVSCLEYQSGICGDGLSHNAEFLYMSLIIVTGAYMTPLPGDMTPSPERWPPPPGDIPVSDKSMSKC